MAWTYLLSEGDFDRDRDLVIPVLGEFECLTVLPSKIKRTIFIRHCMLKKHIHLKLLQRIEHPTAQCTATCTFYHQMSQTLTWTTLRILDRSTSAMMSKSCSKFSQRIVQKIHMKFFCIYCAFLLLKCTKPTLSELNSEPSCVTAPYI